MKIRIGSRESRLAVIQSEIVKEFLERKLPDCEVSLVTMKTTGDIILDRTLDKVGGKGLFVKELDRALLDGRTDLSVHSLKDLPMEVPDTLPVVAYSAREDERDALVLPKGADTIDFSKPIGTSSLRRVLQLKRIYPEAVFESVRGNVVTRIRKLDEGQYGALVLAAAGLKRMGFEDRISRYFTSEEVIPAAGQGILAVQGRSDADYSFLDAFDNRDSRAAAEAERAFVRTLDGGCSSPIAAHGVVEGDILTLRGLYYEEGASDYEVDVIRGPVSDAQALGMSLAERFLERHVKSGKTSGPVQEKKTGKVYLVGAGPGDAGLLTLKGKRVLDEADVVVYDRLVGDGVLSMIPGGARRIDVGKRAGRHTMPQEQINQLLLSEAEKGLRVVRLKGGDPFLFGRGGEELELLEENGISYEIVPGVTSPIAVPAYNGIPVTHRDYCSSLHIITGHQKAGEPLKIAFDALVNTKGTLVFLMGISALGGIMRGLLEAGMDPDMPAAVLSKGTTARQNRIIATVGTLEEKVREKGVVTPAIIVVGKVCKLSETFCWYEKLPLAGYKVVVTRPAGRSGKMSELLRAKGAEVLEIPAIVTEAIPDNQALLSCIKKINSYQWVVFTSPYGVRIFFEELDRAGGDIRSLAGCRFAVIGEGTGKELRLHGIRADLMPEQFDGESLGTALCSAVSCGDRILLPRARMGNSEILSALEGVPDLEIDDIPVYDTYLKTDSVIDEKQLFEEKEADLAVFTSASTVRGFVHAAGGLDYTKVKAACIGKQTAAEAAKYQMQVYTAQKATLESLTELVEQIRKQDKEIER